MADTPTGTAPAEQREQLQALSSWGWVDRDLGLIHIPIDRAIDELVAAQQKEAIR